MMMDINPAGTYYQRREGVSRKQTRIDVSGNGLRFYVSVPRGRIDVNGGDM